MTPISIGSFVATELNGAIDSLKKNCHMITDKYELNKAREIYRKWSKGEYISGPERFWLNMCVSDLEQRKRFLETDGRRK